jgi:hypothetical protein
MQPTQISPGHKSYAFQQAAMYDQFREQATDAFMRARNLYRIRSAL